MIFFILALGGQTFLYAQDVENVAKDLKKIADAKPVKVSGGFGATSAFYNMNGMPSRRAPFSWALNGNVNISIFSKISIPLSINYTDNGTSYSAKNPLKTILADLANKTGMSPKYKWVTLHLGDRSLNFSRYTYAGLRFFGAGVELAPTKSIVKFSGFYGRFNRRTLLDTINGIAVVPAYKRIGWGTKLELGKQKNKVGISIFKAQDDTYSGDELTEKYNLKPMSNLVFGIETKNQIAKKVDLDFEYTTSALTTDLRAPEALNSGDYTYFNNLGNIFTPNSSTIYNSTYAAGIQVKEKSTTVGLKYLWVDPTYASLGALAAKNDIEAYTLNSTTSIFKNKVTLGGSLGTERNNLENNMAQTMRRFIYALNGTWLIIPNLNFTYNYSNFNHSTAPTTITKADSVKLVQVSASNVGSLNYTFGKGNAKHTALISSTFQNVRDIRQLVNMQVSTPNDVTNYLANYSVNFNNIQLTCALSGNYNKVEAPNIFSESIGPSLSLTKKLIQKKLSITYVTSYLNNNDNGAKAATFATKLGGVYKPGKKHSFKLETALVNKNIKSGQGNSFTETLGKISYDFSF